MRFMNSGRFLAAIVAVLVASSLSTTASFATSNSNPESCATAHVDDTSGRDQASKKFVCCVSTYYTLTHVPVKRPYPGQLDFKSGPGGHVHATKTGTTTITWDVRAGAEAEAGVILAKAKTSISAGLAKAQTSTFSYDYGKDVTPGKFGHLQFMNWSERVSYVKYQNNSNCTTTRVASGIVDLPGNQEGFFYWETSS